MSLLFGARAHGKIEIKVSSLAAYCSGILPNTFPGDIPLELSQSYHQYGTLPLWYVITLQELPYNNKTIVERGGFVAHNPGPKCISLYMTR
jgi:hypothetical protein